MGSTHPDPSVETASDSLLDLVAEDPAEHATVNDTRRKTVVRRSYDGLRMIVTFYNINTVVEPSCN